MSSRASLTSWGEGTLVDHPASECDTLKMPYVDVLHRPASKPIFSYWLVKTESGFTVISAETDLGGWTLVVAVISVDPYPFLVFSDLTCHLEDMGIGFSGSTVLPDSKETKNLEVTSDQEASSSTGKKTGVVLVPCTHMEVHPYSYFW